MCTSVVSAAVSGHTDPEPRLWPKVESSSSVSRGSSAVESRSSLNKYDRYIKGQSVLDFIRLGEKERGIICNAQSTVKKMGEGEKGDRVREDGGKERPTSSCVEGLSHEKTTAFSSRLHMTKSPQ